MQGDNVAAGAPMVDPRGSSYFQMIQDCEAAIVRVRAAIRAGATADEVVGADLHMILESVEDRLVRYAKQVAFLGPEAFEEALDALRDRLLDDIWSLGYTTMETQFGAYLKTRPLRVLQQIARKYGRTSVSPSMERLDRPAGDEGQTLGDTLADPAAGDPFDALADADEQHERTARLASAIDALPPDERLVIRQRMAGAENNAIARQLGVSAATATRIYKRALDRLRQAEIRD